jgi:peptidoglycan/LPS O-acetylase OafA/YrhL
LISIGLLFLVLLRGTILRSFLETKPLQFLGDISFSLYLLHSPVLLVTAYLTDFDLTLVFIAFLFVFPLSYFSFKFVEQPSMKLARKLRS